MEISKKELDVVIKYIKIVNKDNYSNDEILFLRKVNDYLKNN